MTTFAPAEAKVVLTAAPMPRAPPVTIAVFPDKRISTTSPRDDQLNATLVEHLCIFPAHLLVSYDDVDLGQIREV